MTVVCLLTFMAHIIKGHAVPQLSLVLSELCWYLPPICSETLRKEAESSKQPASISRELTAKVLMDLSEGAQKHKHTLSTCSTADCLCYRRSTALHWQAEDQRDEEELDCQVVRH